MDTQKYGVVSAVKLRLRLKIAWAVLRNRPVAFRITVRGGIEISGAHSGGYVVACEVRGGGK